MRTRVCFTYDLANILMIIRLMTGLNCKGAGQNLGIRRKYWDGGNTWNCYSVPALERQLRSIAALSSVAE